VITASVLLTFAAYCPPAITCSRQTHLSPPTAFAAAASGSVTEKGAAALKAPWLSQGHQHAAPGVVPPGEEEPQTMLTFRRKPKSYAPTKEVRNASLPAWVVENEAAGGGKKKGGAKKGGGKKKK